MSFAQWIDLGILILSGIFGLLGVLFTFQGLFGGRGRSRYGVGRLRARRAAMVRFGQGVALLVVSLSLLGAWNLFQNNQETILEEAQPFVETTQPAIATPVPSTASETPALPTPDIATEPLPTATSEPSPLPTDVVEEVEEAEVVEEPTAEEPTEEPTPEFTATPTKPPYDAEVRVVGGVNLRDAPNGNVLVLIEDGAGVFLLEGRERAGRYAWQEIRTLDNTIGWVAEQFLVLVE